MRRRAWGWPAAAVLALAAARAITVMGGQAEVVPINGPAWWITPPVGPDFQGFHLRPQAARNPSRATWAATVAQRARYLADQSVPENVQVSRNGKTTGAVHVVTDFSEVMLAIDPTDANHLLGCSKFFYDPQRYRFFTGVLESTDGGLTWDQREPEGVEHYSLTSDPVSMFDGAGNGFFALLTRGPTGLDLLQKPPGGDWRVPATLVDRSTTTDKEWIAADQDPQRRSPYAGNLYVSWTAVGDSQTPDRVVFARSVDGNATWSPPTVLASRGVQGSVPGVAPDGAVHVVYGRDVFGGPHGTLEIATSRDGGVSFGAPITVTAVVPVPYQLPNSTFRTPASMPAFAVSPVDGALYVAWSDYRSGDADIHLSRSTDGGATWSQGRRLNDDPIGNGVDQFQPQVSVAPNGRVAVSWFDRRLPCPQLRWIPVGDVGRENFCIDTFMTRSSDGGETWEPNRRVSAQTWDWSLNLPFDYQRIGFIGDYQGLASSPDADFPFWNATANLGHNPDNHQQVFVARVPVATGPSPTPGGTPSPTVTRTEEPSPTPTGTESSTSTATATSTVSPPPSATPTETPSPPPTVLPPPVLWSIHLPYVARAAALRVGGG